MSEIKNIEELEKRLKKYEQRYRDLFFSSPLMVVLLDIEGKIVDVNPAILNYYDLTKEDFINIHFSNLKFIPENLTEGLSIVFKRTLKTKILDPLELPLLDRHGKKRWASLQGNVIEINDKNYIQVIVQDIDERKKLKDLLKKTQEELFELNRELEKNVEQRIKQHDRTLKQFQATLNNIPDIIAEMDLKGTIKYISPQTQKLLGYAPEELLGKRAYKLLPPDALHDVFQEVKNMVRGSPPQKPDYHDITFELETTLETKNGTLIPVSFRGTFIETDEEKRVIGVIRDMSEQKAVEIDLVESERRYRHLFHSAPIMICMIDTNGEIVEANNPFKRFFVGMNTDIKGKYFKDLVVPTPYNSEFILSRFEECLIRGSIEPIELRVIDHHGKEKWISLKTALMQIKSQFYTHVIIMDISEQKISELKLRHSEEKFRTLVQNSPNAVMLLNYDGIMQDCNAIAQEILGLRAEKIHDRNFFALFRLDDNEHFINLEPSKKLKIGNNIYPITLKFTNWKGREAWVDFMYSIVTIEDELLIQVVSSDITANKKAEQLIKDEMEKLKEIDRLKDEFVYRASHELKTPLNAINAASDILLRYYSESLNEKIKKFLGIINQGGERLNILVKDLIDVTKIESKALTLEKMEGNLIEIVKSGIDLSRTLAEMREHVIELQLDEKIMISIDASKIEQVILNIMTNAIKNTPPGGKIVVTSNLETDYVDISISDNGVGFTTIEKERVFEKFGKIERHGKGMDLITEGSGLGLYISKEIIEMHGGQILLESDGRNKGSKFTIRLPR